ncbi:UPF0057-domain-containing protein [Phialemonium atrogriseum]|uniref:UPF0057-domain-containing protein n=1 Tax=Phialemonium atrogriseum TaxID=1093897 RepID=A0AAJ0C8N3_9PEZI|nr:UPF0057-domain-containing protein [Phialemonium atrogriseum]KAK1771542.1 UPF0057-domain-containing protein [Phialemonium atrogriseum]
MCSADIFLGLLAILFPPLPVWVKRGICSADSLINILLFVLGYIPGLIHAWYIIAKFPEPGYDYEGIPQDDERGRFYVFVHDGGSTQARQPPRQPKPQGNMSYGTTDNANSSGSGPKPSAAPAPGPGPAHDAGQGGSSSNDGPAPPSYAQVVAGDHKIQSQE